MRGAAEAARVEARGGGGRGRWWAQYGVGGEAGVPTGTAGGGLGNGCTDRRREEERVVDLEEDLRAVAKRGGGGRWRRGRGRASRCA